LTGPGSRWAVCMANVRAIYSAGTSLATFLRTNYPAELRGPIPCEFRLVSGAELEDLPEQGTVLSLLLYRVTVNEHLRNARTADPRARPGVPLSVDLHYLMTAWAGSALAEHTILAWAMQQFHQRPVLDAASLTSDAGWGPGEVLHVIPEELSTEDLMRIWDALAPAYRLSVSYTARVVRIDTQPEPDALPVVAERYELRDREEVP
jgi:hypothetical protein